LKFGDSDAAIKHIASDSVSGAAEIMRRAGDAFSLLRSRNIEQPSGTVQEAKQAILNVGVALVRAQPYMTPLLQLANAAVSAIGTEADFQGTLRSAEEAVLKFIEDAQRATHAAALNAANLVHDGSTILTHSRSSTVIEAFLEAHGGGREFRVIVTESRPMLEGRLLGESLAEKGIRVTLIAEAAASLVMDQVELVLVGADQVTPEHLFNKIGTRMIALAARESGLPVYAVCDGSKFCGADYSGRFKHDERSSSELWPSAPPGIDIVNRYFEPVPLAHFTAIITEAGALSIDEASRRAEAASIDGALEEEFERLRAEIR
jgi:translation initiation factor 2B subunit (eIF-2B alpha/beta/delta family)